MTTMTHPRAFHTAPVNRKPRQSSPARVDTRSARVRDGWLDRLGAWSDRQPAHRRMGSWVAAR